MKRLCIGFLLVLVFFEAKSITDTTFNYGTIPSGRYIRLSIIPTGFHYEMLGNPKNSIVLSMQFDYTIAGVVGYARGSGRRYSFYAVNPSINLSYRYYYNYKKRIRKNRDTDFRSLNYIGLMIENRGLYYYAKQSSYNTSSKQKIVRKEIIKKEDLFYYYAMYVGPVWGFQRTIRPKKRMYWGAEWGVGYNMKQKPTERVGKPVPNYNPANISIIGNGLTIGFVL